MRKYGTGAPVQTVGPRHELEKAAEDLTFLKPVSGDYRPCRLLFLSMKGFQIISSRVEIEQRESPVSCYLGWSMGPASSNYVALP